MTEGGHFFQYYREQVRVGVVSKVCRRKRKGISPYHQRSAYLLLGVREHGCENCPPRK